MTNENLSNNHRKARTGVLVQATEGETVSVGAAYCRFIITTENADNRLGLYEISIPPDTIGARLHYHELTDETFIVQKGILTVQVGDEQSEAPEGAVIFVPRLTPHAFFNRSAEEVKILLVFSPANGREGFFRELFALLADNVADPAKFQDLNLRYDTYSV